MCEYTVRVLSVDAACEACGARTRLPCLGGFSGWALSHYQPKVIAIRALVNGEQKWLVPR